MVGLLKKSKHLKNQPKKSPINTYPTPLPQKIHPKPNSQCELRDLESSVVNGAGIWCPD